LNPSSSSSTDPPPENNQHIQQHEAPKNPNKIWMPKLQSLNSPLLPLNKRTSFQFHHRVIKQQVCRNHPLQLPKS